MRAALSVAGSSALGLACVLALSGASFSGCYKNDRPDPKFDGGDTRLADTGGTGGPGGQGGRGGMGGGLGGSGGDAGGERRGGTGGGAPADARDVTAPDVTAVEVAGAERPTPDVPVVPCPTGTHRQDAGCVPNDVPACCGDSCAMCPSMPNATAGCVNKLCTSVCNPGHTRMGTATPCIRHNTVECCGVACRTCPNVDNGARLCGGTANQETCGFTCHTGYRPSGDRCVANDSPDCCGDSCTNCPAIEHGNRRCSSARTCDPECNRGYMREGTAPAFRCVASTAPGCCGTACLDCPTPANSTRICTAAGCDFICHDNYRRVGNGCVRNDTASCCGPSCAMCSVTRPNSIATCNNAASCANPSPCRSGWHDCGGTCRDNASVDSCGSACSPCPARANATASCDGNGCVYTCVAGRGNCDGNWANGCEVDLNFDPLNCGRCHPNQAGDPSSMANHPGPPACTSWNQVCCSGACIDDTACPP